MNKDRIWFKEYKLKDLNQFRDKTIVECLDINFTKIGDDFLEATMPVNNNTVQPQRILHGGASVVLAETMGSVASWLVSDPALIRAAVGVEINANHLSSAQEGDLVTGVVRPIKIGRKLHIWEVRITNHEGKLCCISRFTAMTLPKK